MLSSFQNLWIICFTGKLSGHPVIKWKIWKISQWLGEPITERRIQKTTTQSRKLQGKPRPAKATAKAPTLPGQGGPRKNSRNWAPGRSHQDVPTLSTICMSRFFRLGMEAWCLSCLRYGAKFPKSQPLKASGLPMRAFISLWYLLRITYQLDSLPSLLQTGSLQRKEIYLRL